MPRTTGYRPISPPRHRAPGAAGQGHHSLSRQDARPSGQDGRRGDGEGEIPSAVGPGRALGRGAATGLRVRPTAKGRSSRWFGSPTGTGRPTTGRSRTAKIGIEDALDGESPESFSPALTQERAEVVHHHLFDAGRGGGRGVHRASPRGR